MIKPKIIEADLGLNPLVESGFKIVVSKNVDWSSYEYIGEDLLPKEVQLERGYIVKVYASAENRDKVAALSTPAKALFLWIAYELEYGQDWVWVNKAKYMKTLGIASGNTYRAAVSDLVKSNIIALTVKRNVFWINPKFFFCGNRAEKYPDHIEVYKPKNPKYNEILGRNL